MPPTTRNVTHTFLSWPQRLVPASGLLLSPLPSPLSLTLLHQILPFTDLFLWIVLNVKIAWSKIYWTYDADLDWLSDVDNFPPLYSLVENCLYMKPVKNVESSHLGNGRSFVKSKLSLSKAIDKNKPIIRVSTRRALIKIGRWFYDWVWWRSCKV